MGAFSGLLGFSILFGFGILSAIATLLFVSAFSIGLGPLPGMVASHRIEPKGVGAAKAIPFTSNWLGTFLVGFVVPVIAPAAGMSAVFFIFAILSIDFFLWGLS
ncbi:hypothetical protein HOY80DRAFT_1000990 [Tuber brumale]|nr:hypothetical protein HOY80DRAFT_1000990 [Tuber brumale]